MKEKNILSRFGKRLRALRKSCKMSQEKLAEKADLSTTFIGYLERAEKEPTLSSLDKIARAFSMSASELLRYPDDRNLTDSEARNIDKLIDFLKDALEKAKEYRKDK